MADGTRTRLIGCALDVLAHEGVDAVTVRRVARDAGISHGAPLRHFANRAALLSAMAAAGYARLEACFGAIPRDRLADACESYVDFARGAPALFELMFRPDMTTLGTAAFARFRAFVPGSDLTAVSLWAALRGLALRPDAYAVLAVTLAAHSTATT